MARLKKSTDGDAVRGFWGLSPFLFTLATGLTLLIIISVFLLGNLYIFLRNPRGEVDVPDVTGFDFSEAKKALDEKKLKINIILKEYSDSVERDHIIRHEPAAGTNVKMGRVIQVVLSLGKRDIKTPNLIGMDIDAAKGELRKLSLQADEPESRYSDKASAGIIINQSPRPGSLVAKGEKIRLIISKGPETRSVEMPELKGMSLGEALSTIDSLGLRVSRITRVYSASARDEKITGQAPKEGRLIKRGSEVILTLTLPSYRQTLGERSFRVKVDVPEAEAPIDVSIIKNDRNSTEEVFREMVNGPATIEQMVAAYGHTTISIYFDGKLVREETF